jgi:hypothetical protein
VIADRLDAAGYIVQLLRMRIKQLFGLLSAGLVA